MALLIQVCSLFRHREKEKRRKARDKIAFGKKSGGVEEEVIKRVCRDK